MEVKKEFLKMLIKLSLLIYLIYQKGILIGLAVFAFLNFAFVKFTENIFNIKKLSQNDKCLLSKNKDKINIVCQLEFDDFDPIKIKGMLEERCIKKLERFRSKLIYKFFDFYWKVCDEKEVSNQIKIVDKTFKTPEEVKEFSTKQLNLYYDQLKDFLWEIFILKYENGKGAILVKMDHLMSDGLGIVSFVCCLADNYSEEVFPAVMRNRKPQIFKEFLFEVLCFILFPILFPIVVFRNLFTKHSHLHLKKNSSNEITNSIFSFTKEYNLEIFDNLRKVNKVSINDAVLTLISKSLNQRIKQIYKCDSCDIFFSLVTIGNKQIPKNLQEVQINNASTGIVCRIPLVNDVNNGIKKIHKEIRSQLSNMFELVTLNYILFLISEIAPIGLLRESVNSSYRNMDCIISNVPGPSKALYYSGMKLINIIPLLSTSVFKIFIPVISYDKKFKILVAIDEKLSIRPQEIVEEFEKVIEEDIIGFNNSINN